MNKTVLVSSFFLVLAFLTDCSNDFDIIDDWKSIPVVYALLSSSEEDNYFRIEKAFLDPEIGGPELARRPDSLYYDNILVELERVSNNERITLQEVNAEDLGFVREEGVFATSPNIIYTFKTSNFPLADDEEIRLIITDTQTEQILTEATTKVVGQYESISTKPANPINFRYETDFSIGCRSDELQARFYDIEMKIKYQEQDPNTPNVWIDKELDWIIETGIPRTFSSGGVFSPQVSASKKGEAFFQFVGANVDDTENVLRRFRGIDIFIDAGGEELFNYVNVGAANTGITSNQIIRSYTNMSNGLGIFSSRNRLVIKDYNLDSFAQDSLLAGRYTKHLNFQ